MNDFVNRDESLESLLQRAWVTEWSPRGALYARRLTDALKLNEQACLGERSADDVRVVINVAASQEAARAYIRSMKSKKKQRQQAQEGE